MDPASAGHVGSGIRGQHDRILAGEQIGEGMGGKDMSGKGKGTGTPTTVQKGYQPSRETRPASGGVQGGYTPTTGSGAPPSTPTSGSGGKK